MEKLRPIGADISRSNTGQRPPSSTRYLHSCPACGHETARPSPLAVAAPICSTRSGHVPHSVLRLVWVDATVRPPTVDLPNCTRKGRCDFPHCGLRLHAIDGDRAATNTPLLHDSHRTSATRTCCLAHGHNVVAPHQDPFPDQPRRNAAGLFPTGHRRCLLQAVHCLGRVEQTALTNWSVIASTTSGETVCKAPRRQWSLDGKTTSLARGRRRTLVNLRLH